MNIILNFCQWTPLNPTHWTFKSLQSVTWAVCGGVSPGGFWLAGAEFESTADFISSGNWICKFTILCNKQFACGYP